MKFTRKGALAIDPHYANAEWEYTAPAEKRYQSVNGVAIITIRGPLSHHPDWYFESYDEIVDRVRAAHADPEVKAILFEGDTPGGEVGGCFASARILRRLADESGKPTVWYVDGQTCSAGLALAMSCDRVVIPPEGRFGSIGVIAELQSMAEISARQGVETRLITSGARKADGHPLAPITDEAIAAIQESVDYEASLFWDWVSERTTIPVDKIRSWQAAVFHGQQAIDLGLADALTDDLGALVMAAEATKKEEEMPGLASNSQASTSAKKASLEEARKMLGELASDDSDEGRAARKMLDASDAKAEEKEPKHEEPDGDESAVAAAEDDTDASAAEDDTDASAAEDKSDEDQAKAEEASAKACSAAAAKAESDARAILRSGAKDAAKRADAKLAEADRMRAKAAQHSKWAKVFASNARTQALVKASRKAVVPASPTAALAGHAAKGTPPATPAPPPAAAAAGMPAYMLRAAGIGPSTAAVGTDLDSIELGALTPEQANAAFAVVQNQINAVKGAK